MFVPFSTAVQGYADLFDPQPSMVGAGSAESQAQAQAMMSMGAMMQQQALMGLTGNLWWVNMRCICCDAI